MYLKKKILTAALVFLSISATSKVKTIVHYNFGKAGNVTYAVAPEKLTPVAGTGELSAVGRPVFYADAPSDKAAKGHGAILFGGEKDGYQSNAAIGTASQNQVFEVWAKARGTEGGQRIVASNGDGKHGYVIAQRGKDWVFISGGTGIVKIGEVAKGQWAHLAAVVNNGKGSVWMNGKKTADFRPTEKLADNFSVATSTDGKE
ncbi:MAG: LamG-like jellyroll fold domain-containing protein, partial [Muribaculaceae bacterium]